MVGSRPLERSKDMRRWVKVALGLLMLLGGRSVAGVHAQGGCGVVLCDQHVHLPITLVDLGYDPCDDWRRQNDSCAMACLLGLTPPNDPLLGTISGGTDQDWFETVPLGAGDYRLTLVPPEGLDYDLQLYAPSDPSRRSCPGALVAQSNMAGDATEVIEFTIPVVAAGFTTQLRVFPAFRDHADRIRPYALQLSPLPRSGSYGQQHLTNWSYGPAL